MIRRATVADIPALQQLLGQILRVHHEARPDLFKAEGSKFTDAELEVLIKTNDRPIFVYEDDGQILGHLFLEKKRSNGSVEAPVKTMFIDDLCVDEAGRGKGIGQAMYDFALEYAKQEGCYHLTLNVWNDNQSALAFYEKQGMKPLYTQMEVKL